MSGIVLTEVADATIPTPAAGKVTVYMSVEEAGPAFKDDAAAVTALQGAAGATGATGAAGATGPPGAGVPPTVQAHGSMGAAETFNYTTAPSHEGTVDAALTITLAGFVAGECIMSLGFTTDGTGGYGVPTFPASVVNDADLAAVWDDAAGAYNLIVLRTVDSGTTVYIVGLDDAPTLDAVIAVSSGEDIADALSGAAAPDAGNVFATMADVPAGVSFSGAKVYKTSQTVSNGTKLAFDVELWDISGYHDAGDNTKLTAPSTGHYLAEASSFMGAAARLEVFVNGSIVEGRGNSGYASNYGNTLALLALTAGDYVEINLASGGSVQIGDGGSAGDYTVFSLTKLG